MTDRPGGIPENCGVCRSPHTVVVVEKSPDTSADWPAALCEPCWDDVQSVWGDYTTIDEKATRTLEAQNDDRQKQLVTDGGERPTDEVYHVVCHGCPFEEVVEGDRVLAAANEIVHRKRTDHAVEYAAIGTR